MGEATPSDHELTKAFAREHRLRVRMDECGDAILANRGFNPKANAHLYFAGGELCAIWTDQKPIKPSRLAGLKARWSWQGDISRNGTGRRVQDNWAKGIPAEAHGYAIQLARLKRLRVLSPEERERRARLAKELGKQRQAARDSR